VIARAHHARGILDTNAVIRLGQLDPTMLPDEPLITTVTLAELTAGPLTATSEQERADRQMHLQWAETHFEALPFDVAAARSFGLVSAAFRRAGRKPAARSLDGMIAAIALAHGLPLYTANPDDFAHIAGLVVVPI